MGTLRTGTVIACTFAVSFFPAVSHAAAATGSAIPVETVVYEQGEKAQILAEGLSAYNHKDYANATILLREAVAGVHKHDIVARGLRQPFVHRVVDAVIGL